MTEDACISTGVLKFEMQNICIRVMLLHANEFDPDTFTEMAEHFEAIGELIRAS